MWKKHISDPNTLRCPCHPPQSWWFLLFSNSLVEMSGRTWDQSRAKKSKRSLLWLTLGGSQSSFNFVMQNSIWGRGGQNGRHPWEGGRKWISGFPPPTERIRCVHRWRRVRVWERGEVVIAYFFGQKPPKSTFYALYAFFGQKCGSKPFFRLFEGEVQHVGLAHPHLWSCVCCSTHTTFSPIQIENWVSWRFTMGLFVLQCGWLLLPSFNLNA